jgi:hypothetical protein
MDQCGLHLFSNSQDGYFSEIYMLFYVFQMPMAICSNFIAGTISSRFSFILSFIVLLLPWFPHFVSTKFTECGAHW